MHLTGGITGFIGTYRCGPRIGLVAKDKQYLYILDEDNCIASGETEKREQTVEDTHDQDFSVKKKKTRPSSDSRLKLIGPKSLEMSPRELIERAAFEVEM